MSYSKHYLNSKCFFGEIFVLFLPFTTFSKRKQKPWEFCFWITLASKSHLSFLWRSSQVSSGDQLQKFKFLMVNVCISIYTSRQYNSAVNIFDITEVFTLLQIEQDSEINSHLPVNMSPSQESSPAKKVRTYHVIFSSKSFQIYKINYILPYILIFKNYIVQ